MDVVKLDADGNERIRYAGERLAVHVPNGIGILARWTMKSLDVGYVTFAQGDFLHEYFYQDRWYNVFALYDGGSRALKGWYCNVTRPSCMTDTAVFWSDLALDVWVSPLGEAMILDEDEFATLGLGSAETTQAYQAITDLLNLAKNNQLPK